MTNSAARVRTGKAEQQLAAQPAQRILPTISSPAGLFRREVLEEQRAEWIGSVLLRPRISHSIFAAGAALAALAVVMLLTFGSYTRKERLGGRLLPDGGIARVVATRSGIITQVNVEDGATVVSGTPLLVVSGEVQSQAAGPVQEEIIRQLKRQRDSLAAERRVQESLSYQQAEDIDARIIALRSEQENLANEASLQIERVQLIERKLARLKLLRAKGLVAEPQLELAEESRLELAAELESLRRSQANLRRTLAELEGSQRQLPFTRSIGLADVDRSIARVEEELTEAESHRSAVIAAPRDGVVTNLQAVEGSHVQGNVPLLSIVPAGSKLHAQLFASSRAIGFVHPGQNVLLRYDAFPYQKFGFYEGVVASVGQAALSPSDLPTELSGLSSIFKGGEPLYEVSVELAQQTATAYGEAVRLQPGMQLSADILIERRSLLEWALEPVFSLDGGRP